MESQPQNPEFRNNPENFTHAYIFNQYFPAFHLYVYYKQKSYLKASIQMKLKFSDC